MRALKGHKGSVRCVAYSPNCTVLASAGDDGLVKLWNRETGVEEVSLPMAANRLAFSPDSSLLAMTAYGIVAVWNLTTSTPLPPATPFRNYPTAVAFLAEPRLLLVGLGWSDARDNKILAWDLQSARFLDEFGPRTQAVDTLALSPSRPLLAIASRDHPPTDHNSVRLWDWSSRRNVGLLEQTEHTPYPVRAMAFSPDGRLLAVADHHPIHLWDVKKKHVIISLVGHKRQVNTLAFTPDGQTLLSGDNDAVVRAWDVGSGRQRAVFDWGLGAVRSVAVAPDGMTAAAAGERPDVMVWDLDVPTW